jgi:hypothetical protein
VVITRVRTTAVLRQGGTLGNLQRDCGGPIAGGKRPATPPTTSAVETITTDVIEEAAPGQIAITEFEETQEREEGEGPERPEETPKR